MARLYPLFEMAQGTGGVSLGQGEYDGILRGSMLCESMRLIDGFDDQFDFWWYEQEMVPDLAVPLTALGRRAVEHTLANASAV